MSFPTKEERTRCWDSRDRYWECLDKNGEKDAVKGGPCGQLRDIFEKSCTPQWAKHFDKRRSYLQFKHRIETEGYEPLDNEKYGK